MKLGSESCNNRWKIGPARRLFLRNFAAPKLEQRSRRWPTRQSSILLISLALISLACLHALGNPSLLGDLDGDGYATVLDLVWLQNHLSGAERIVGEGAVFADLNQDGFATQEDVDLLVQAILGLSALPTLPLARIVDTSPANGASQVAVTRETIFRLSQPLAASAVVTPDKFHADFGARRFLSRVEVSDDRRSLTLFYLENLPGSTRIRVTLNANTIIDFAARALDADGDGQPGGTAVIEFETLGLTPNPDAIVCGRVFASQLATNAPGGTNQSINIPLAGVIITADGLEESVRAVTDQLGDFRLTNAPGGEFFVHIDGRLITNLTAGIRYPDLAYYPYVGKLWKSIPGREVNIGEIYLPLVAQGTLTSVSATGTTLIAFPPDVLTQNPELAGVALTVPANALFSDGGTRGGSVGIAPVPPDRLPEKLPDGLDPAIVITVQTDGGQNFSQPVPVCFPNLTNAITGEPPLPPGAKTALWSFNHDSGHWEVVGPMTISADGRLACSDPGVGIRQPGWHFAAPGAPGGSEPPDSEGGGEGGNPPKHSGCNPVLTCCRKAQGEGGSNPVHVHSGEKEERVVDLYIKAVGMDFIWQRTYNSRHGPKTAQGNGWDFSYNIAMAKSGRGIQFLNGASRGELYRPVVGQTNAWARNGFYNDLTQDPDGALTMRMGDGRRIKHHPFDGRPEAGKVQSLTDRNGNQIQFQYDGQGRLIRVLDTLGRPIAIAYNADGFIASVTDFAGRAVRYEYYRNNEPGGGFGDLKAVITPAVTGTPNGNDFPEGKRTLYTYSTGFADDRLNHNLLTITDARGIKYLENVYAATTDPKHPLFDRVVRQILGGEIIDFTYQFLTPSPANHNAVFRAIVNDRMGNVTEHFFDAGDRLVMLREYAGRANPRSPTTDTVNRPTGKLRAGDPDFFETRYTYNANFEQVRIIHPNGNITENVYEADLNAAAPAYARGNLRVVRHLPGDHQPPGDQAVITEQYDYDTSFGCGSCGFNFVVREVDGRGGAILSDYDERGNLTNRTERIPSITERWEYNARGQVTRHVHPDESSGHRRVDQFVYYETGPSRGYLKEEIVDSGGFNLTTRYEYDLVGNVTRRIDPRGHDTQYVYNALDQVVREISREVIDGSDVRYRKDFAYDANNNAARIDVLNLDESGIAQPNSLLTTSFEYNVLNRVIRRADEVAESRACVTEYDYDANQNLAQVRYGEATAGRQPANRVRFEYDERNLLFREIRAPGAPDQSSTQYAYDGNRNLDVITEGLEAATPHTATLIYDSYNRLVAAADPMGNVTTHGYDGSHNRVRSRVDGELVDVPGGNANVRLSEVTFGYDALKRLTNTAAAFFNPSTQAPILGGQAVTQIEYNGLSQVIRVVNANGHATTIAYDTANRRRTLTDAKGNSITLNYDANGNVVQTTEVEKSDLGDPDELFTTRFDYDNLNRLIATVDNVNTANRYLYDSRNNRTLTVDGRGNVVRYTFDGLNRLTDTIREMTDTGDGSGNVVGTITTRQTWDDSGRLTSQIDDNGNATTYVYDALNRRVATIYADGTGQTNTLDVHDNAVLFTDANGNRVTNSYDAGNRVVRKDIAVGPGVSPDTTFEAFQYDGLSRIVRAQDDDSVVQMAYDSLGRAIADVQNGQTVGSVYDPVGNLLACLYPGGRAVINTFDQLERLKTVGDADGIIATYAYTGPGRVKQRDYKNGVRMTYAYDGITGVPNLTGDFGVKQIIRTTHARIADAAVLDDRVYTWDRAGNKTSHYELHTGGSQRDYAYDSVNRLIRSVRRPATGASEAIQYNLDGVGNRLSVIGGSNAGPYTMSATLPEPGDRQLNQYTTTPFDTRSNDRNGNVVAINLGPAQERTLTYDHRNQMVGFAEATPSVTAQYAYDALGRRIGQQVTGVNPEDVRFVHNGWRVVEEQNRAGGSLADYLHGGYIDEVLQMRRGGQEYYYQSDHLYSVVALTSPAGTVLERYAYSDYGMPTRVGSGEQLGSALGNPHLFTGREFGGELGFSFYRTRYYDPKAGRFAGRDSIGVWGDAHNLGNSFALVHSAPTYELDPFGLYSVAMVTSGDEGSGCAGPTLEELYRTNRKAYNDELERRYGPFKPYESHPDDKMDIGILTGRGYVPSDQPKQPDKVTEFILEEALEEAVAWVLEALGLAGKVGAGVGANIVVNAEKTVDYAQDDNALGSQQGTESHRQVQLERERRLEVLKQMTAEADRVKQERMRRQYEERLRQDGF